MKILVISKDKWKSRLKKHEIICTLLKTGGINATITTEHRDVPEPVIEDGRIEPNWYEKNITKYAVLGDYDHVIFQFSERDGKKWGVDSGIRGHNIKDTDIIGESWVCCDEFSTVKFKDGTVRDKYTKVIPHEIGHELKNRGVTELEIHKYDFKNEINNIEAFYKELGTRATLMDKIKKLTALLLSFKKGYRKPIKDWHKVSQVYGVSDSVTYPLTGHHIGTDFAVPLDTPIVMPADGEVTRNGMSPSLGLWCEVKIDTWYMVCLHLGGCVKPGMYRRGDTIAHVGSTGKIQGIHAHLEVWNEPMDRSKLTKSNWSILTKDITKVIV